MNMSRAGFEPGTNFQQNMQNCCRNHSAIWAPIIFLLSLTIYNQGQSNEI